MTLDDLNTVPEEIARDALLSCCGSELWAAKMLGRRPFGSVLALHDNARAVWHSLSPADWLQAFSRHPKIGESSPNQWSTQEQRGVSQAGPDVADALRKMNAEYESKFGYIFIVCATGKSAAEIYSLLEERSANEPGTELRVAAAEQAKITSLRLEKLLAQ